MISIDCCCCRPSSRWVELLDLRPLFFITVLNNPLLYVPAIHIISKWHLLNGSPCTVPKWRGNSGKVAGPVGNYTTMTALLSPSCHKAPPCLYKRQRHIFQHLFDRRQQPPSFIYRSPSMMGGMKWCCKEWTNFTCRPWPLDAWREHIPAGRIWQRQSLPRAWI